MARLPEGLGLPRIINAADTYSEIGGSVVAPEVADAMAKAARVYVPMEKLQDAVGERIAAITRTEAGMVSAGAAAGLAMATISCTVGNDAARAARLPHKGSDAPAVILQRCQRIPYDHAIRMTGARLVEIGFCDQTAEWELSAALEDGAAAFVHIAGTPFERHAIDLPRACALCHDHGVPVIVDAAAQLPPVENLWRYGEQGADLVVFSGGKGLNGPQGSGIVAGRADLIAAARAHMSPNHGFGRAMKLGREQIVGLMVALELFVARDWKKQHETWETRVAHVVDAFDGKLGLTAERLWPGRLGQHYPRAFIGWSGNPAPRDLIAELASGDPQIHLDLHEDARRGVTINPMVLTNDEEVDIVIRALLGSSLTRNAKAPVT